MEIKDKDGNLIYSLKFAPHGEKRNLNATKEELEAADLVLSMLPPSDDYDIVRKSDAYITVVKGEWDIARIKFTDRAHWIILPLIDVGNKKRLIEQVDDIKQFEGDILKTYEHIVKYS